MAGSAWNADSDAHMVQYISGGGNISDEKYLILYPKHRSRVLIDVWRSTRKAISCCILIGFFKIKKKIITVSCITFGSENCQKRPSSWLMNYIRISGFKHYYYRLCPWMMRLFVKNRSAFIARLDMETQMIKWHLFLLQSFVNGNVINYNTTFS